MSITFGFVFIDRHGCTLFISFIIKDLQLSNTQIGLLISGLLLPGLCRVIFLPHGQKPTIRKKMFLWFLLFCFHSVLSSLGGQTFCITDLAV